MKKRHRLSSQSFILYSPRWAGPYDCGTELALGLLETVRFVLRGEETFSIESRVGLVYKQVVENHALGRYGDVRRRGVEEKFGAVCKRCLA